MKLSVSSQSTPHEEQIPFHIGPIASPSPSSSTRTDAIQTHDVIENEGNQGNDNDDDAFNFGFQCGDNFNLEDMIIGKDSLFFLDANLKNENDGNDDDMEIDNINIDKEVFEHISLTASAAVGKVIIISELKYASVVNTTSVEARKELSVDEIQFFKNIYRTYSVDEHVNDIPARVNPSDAQMDNVVIEDEHYCDVSDFYSRACIKSSM
ncbi:hypothetical protein L1987_13640 [Smallanthus sonchifolius]|uniref:Uncharacterized protein n=1 Tax=Smallanthus sonchifolius TaxID=185202 RepID=A0ACB9JH01_9ASTR|nr:hypothetical protein L1987_13640 [Smallanthus sonchifolius]